MKTKAFFNKILWTCIALLLSLFCVFQSVHIKTANAEETTVTYTDVLEDLQKDSSFKVEDYPAKADDYSLQVIQIAESVNGELFIYVYQPCHDTKDLVATSIALYNGYSDTGDDFTPQMYRLTLLSTSGVFDKYLVDSFTVSSVEERWYNIVSLYRKRDSDIDKGLVFPVGDVVVGQSQQWRFYLYNDEYRVEKGTFKTMYIDIVVADDIIYNNGISFDSLAGIYKKGDSHFICFNVDDYIIKHIFDADVYYTSRKVSRYSGINVPEDSYGKYEDNYVTLHDSDIAVFEGSGWLGKTYKWNRISRSDEFVENLENQGLTFEESAKSDILSSQWTFAFCETERTSYTSMGWTSWTYTEVGDVTILRLHFLDDRDREYNLGVVSNSVTEDDAPAGIGGGIVDEMNKLRNEIDAFWSNLLGFLSDMSSWVIGIGLLALGVIAVAIFAPWVFSLVGKGFLAACKFALNILRIGLRWGWKIIAFIICFPWNFIFKLFKKKNKNRP